MPANTNPNLTMNLNTIYRLAPNEVTQLGDTYWRRVPGGWVVTELDNDPAGEGLPKPLGCCFVPYNDEWKGIEVKGAAPPASVTVPSRMNDEPIGDDDPGF